MSMPSFAAFAPAFRRFRRCLSVILMAAAADFHYDYIVYLRLFSRCLMPRYATIATPILRC